MKKTVSGILLILLLIGMWTLAFDIRPASAQAETVYINSDGSVAPPSAPISSVDNVTYTFTGNISYPTYYGIVIERSNIVFDGKGYTAQGNLSGTGLDLTSTGNVTIKNTNIEGFAFGICLYSSNNNIISGNSVTANYYDGVLLNGSSSNTISGNSVTDNNYGIELEFSSSNTVSGNDIRANHVGGILLGGSSSNSVSENNMTNNLYGIGLVTSSTSLFGPSSYSSSNTIFGNNITANELDGIWLTDSSSNTISGNNVAGNSAHGIYFEASSNNTVYHNNFIGNKLQASVDTWSLGNAWNDTYPSGGNYWSDYTCLDLHKGPYQNETGSDGIGDASCVIDANNTDYYPLMKPYPWGPHDVGVTYIGRCYEIGVGILIYPPRTVAGLNILMHLDVFVMNYGDYPEVTNLTMYANSTIISQVSNVTLAAKNSTILDVLWDTSGFEMGSYTISAYLKPVPGESDVKDNNYTDGRIMITIPGDLNGDGKVSLADLVILAQHFGSKPGTSNWNPNADINDNGKVDLSDLVILAQHFGKN